MTEWLRNAVKCKHCNTVIESTHRHDFKYCPCGKVFVDGGHDYLRRGFQTTPDADYEELSVESDSVPKPGKFDAYISRDPVTALALIEPGVKPKRKPGDSRKNRAGAAGRKPRAAGAGKKDTTP